MWLTRLLKRAPTPKADMLAGYQEYPKWMYHAKHAPQGRVFATVDDFNALPRGVNKGWVDSPAKFPPPSRVAGRLRALKPWWSEWEWAVKALLAILVALVAIAATLVRASSD